MKSEIYNRRFPYIKFTTGLAKPTISQKILHKTQAPRYGIETLYNNGSGSVRSCPYIQTAPSTAHCCATRLSVLVLHILWVSSMVSVGCPHCNMTQNTFPAPTGFRAPSIHTFLNLASGNPWSFHGLHSFVFSRIRQCVAFSDRLLSLRNRHLSFFYVFSWHNSSFAFNTE